MAEVTLKPSELIDAWIQQEQGAFEGFQGFIPIRTTESLTRTIGEYLKRRLERGEPSEIITPFGKFSAVMKTVGEGTNIAPVYEKTEGFDRLLNRDETETDDVDDDITYDKEFIELCQSYLAWGQYDFDEKNDVPAKEKGSRLDKETIEYFMESFAELLAAQARDHQRDGKMFTIEVTKPWDFGMFHFDYEGDNIEPRFNAGKGFKQTLKNDAALEAAA